MKVNGFEVGLESYTRVGAGEAARLPRERLPATQFLPQPKALDAVLHRPSLDERLPDLLVPAGLDPLLLEPAVLTETRLATQAALEQAARKVTGARRRLLEEAALFLDEDAALDEEVRAALAALLKG